MADTKISALTAKATPVAADTVPILDSEDGNSNKRTTLGAIPAAAFSGARRLLGTSVADTDWSTDTDVSSLFDTESFDTDSWWNGSGNYYETPAGVSYVFVGAGGEGVDLGRTRILRYNSSNVLQETVSIGRPSPSGGANSFCGVKCLATSVGDRFRLSIRGLNTTSNLNGEDATPGLTDFWIAKAG